MNFESSESEPDIIDDTGCEDKFGDTYWDINYLQSIENDTAEDNKEDQEENQYEDPCVRSLQRIQYSGVNENGETVQEDYYQPEEESEEYSESSSEDSVNASSSDSEGQPTEEEKRVLSKMRR